VKKTVPVNLKEIQMRKCGAIILAAGKGTRMKSVKAKVTFTLAEKPLIQRVVDTALKINCDSLGIIVGYRKEDVVDCINPDKKIHFLEQTEQLGTGHAVKMADELFGNYEGDVFILCGDVPLLSVETLNRLLTVHRDEQAAGTVLTVVLPDAGSYGRIVRDSKGNVLRIVEYKDANEDERRIREINSGIYCFDSKSLFSALKQVTNNNKQQEYYLTDVLEILNKEGKKVSAVVTDDMAEVSGINSQQQLAELETEHYDRIKNYWLNNGVSIENPTTVLIGDDVLIGNDVQIASNCVLKGKSKIGSFCSIGLNSYLNSSNLEDSVVLEGYNILSNQLVVKGSKIGFGEKRINE